MQPPILEKTELHIIPGSKVINFFHAQLNGAGNLSCSQMLQFVGILTFISRINDIV